MSLKARLPQNSNDPGNIFRNGKYDAGAGGGVKNETFFKRKKIWTQT
jgi:hypothetical protein